MEIKCPICGGIMEEGATVCEYCHSELKAKDESAEASPSKLDRFAEKAKDFELRRGIVTNVIVMICAIVIILVAILAPIKVVLYTNPINKTGDGETSVTYPTIDQSIVNIVETVLLFVADDEKKQESLNDYSAVFERIEERHGEWKASHPNSTNEESENAYAEILAEEISSINYFVFLIAILNENAIITGNIVNAIFTAAMGVILVILIAVMSVISFIYFILSAVNIVKQRPQKSLYRYLSIMLNLAIGGLAITFAAPMFQPGGGIFAVALFIAIAYFTCAAVGGILSGKTDRLVVLKRIIIAVMATVAFFVLCGSMFNIINTSNPNYTTVTSVYVGYGLYGFLDYSQLAETDMQTFMGSAFVGLIMYALVTSFVVGFSSKIMTGSYRRLAYGTGGKTFNTGYFIIAAAFMAITITVGFFSPTIASKIVEAQVDYEVEVQAKWLASARIWVSAIFTVIIAIFNRVFLPEDERKRDKTMSLEQHADLMG